MKREKNFINFENDFYYDKKEMQEKSLNLITELNDYKKMLLDELDRSKECELNKKLYTSNDKEESYMKDIIRMNEDGGDINFSDMDDEGYEIIEKLSLNDHSFALSFLERRKDIIPKDKYEFLKQKLLKKMNIKD